MAAIQALIAETEHWREANSNAGRRIEALACVIRIKALEDALKAISK